MEKNESASFSVSQEQDFLPSALALITRWYESERRMLPWREDPTPYHTWIAEIMLQQTRIEAVIPYYRRFLRELPDIAALAAVPEDRLLKLWEGLGYYSRARNLRRAALLLTQQYGGQLPASVTELKKLPGIGTIRQAPSPPSPSVSRSLRSTAMSCGSCHGCTPFFLRHCTARSQASGRRSAPFSYPAGNEAGLLDRGHHGTRRNSVPAQRRSALRQLPRPRPLPRSSVRQGTLLSDPQRQRRHGESEEKPCFFSPVPGRQPSVSGPIPDCSPVCGNFRTWREAFPQRESLPAALLSASLRWRFLRQVRRSISSRTWNGA